MKYSNLKHKTQCDQIIELCPHPKKFSRCLFAVHRLYNHTQQAALVGERGKEGHGALQGLRAGLQSGAEGRHGRLPVCLGRAAGGLSSDGLVEQKGPE